MTPPPVRHRIITASLLTVAALYFLVPVYWLAVSATKNSADLFGTFGFWFSGHPHPVDHLVDVLTYDHGIYARWFANSSSTPGPARSVPPCCPPRPAMRWPSSRSAAGRRSSMWCSPGC